MAVVPVGASHFATIDDADLPLVAPYRWCAKPRRNTVYAQATVDGRQVFMHRFLLGLKPGDPMVDHRDRDGLNNRRSNLRLASHGLNAANMRPIRGSSRYKGVCWDPVNQKWVAQICVDGKRRNLGRFTDERDAAMAYAQAAAAAWGDFAYDRLD